MKNMMQRMQLQYQGQILTYVLTRKDVKNINIRAKVGEDIEVSAHNQVSITYIEDILLSKWEKLYEIQNQKKVVREKVKQNSCSILGKEYPIQVIESMIEKVELKAEVLMVYLKNPQDEQRKEIWVNHYLDALAKAVFTELFERQYQRFQLYQIPCPVLKIKKMKSRWGSCIPAKNIITLNQSLIHTPKICIEYVILHEFCHLFHPNHSKAFYDFLKQWMANYKEVKDLLNSQTFKI